jgi:hypothetical protein
MVAEFAAGKLLSFLLRRFDSVYADCFSVSYAISRKLQRDFGVLPFYYYFFLLSIIQASPTGPDPTLKKQKFQI